MLPLAVNALHSATGSAPSAVQSAQPVPSSLQQDQAAAARVQLPIAVSASGAPAAFSPDTLQSRQAWEERRLIWHRPSVQSAAAASSSEEADPAHAQAATSKPASLLPNFFNPQPIRLNTSLVSQFTAQFIAQEEPVFTTQPEWKTNFAPKKPGLGQAHGASAYALAVARTQSKRSDTDTSL